MKKVQFATLLPLVIATIMVSQQFATAADSAAPFRKIAADSSGNVYVQEPQSHVIRRYGADGKKVVDIHYSSDFNIQSIAAGPDQSIYFTTQNSWGLKVWRALSSDNYRISSFTSYAALQEPAGIAVDSSGNVYVADKKANAVWKFNRKGELIADVVTPKDNIHQPDDLAVDKDNNVYITSTGFYREGLFKAIPKANNQGYDVRTVGYVGAQPTGIAVDGSGLVYVTKSDEVLTFNAYGDKAAFISPLQSVAIAAQGHRIYLSLGDKILVHDPYSKDNYYDQYTVPVLLIPAKQHEQIESIAVDQHRNVYTTSHVGDRSFAVHKFDPEGKSLVPVKENLDFPAWGLAVDNKDNVYFTVPAKHIVWKAVPDTKDAKSTYSVREFVSMWPTPKVVEPYGVAVDGKGNVYVADDRVLHKFDPYAKALHPVKEGPTPLHVTLDGLGNVYFTLGHTADKASPKPNSEEYNVETFVTGLNNTAGIAVDSTGQAYVADFNSGKIHTHSSKGAQLSHVFRHPHGLAVDSSNNLYIADIRGVSKACRLHIFVRHGASEQIAAE